MRTVVSITMTQGFLGKLLERRQGFPSRTGLAGYHANSHSYGKCRHGQTQRVAACGAHSQIGFKKPAATPSSGGKALKSRGKAGVTSSIATGRMLRDGRAKLPFVSSKKKMVRRWPHAAASGARGRMGLNVAGKNGSKESSSRVRRRATSAPISGTLSSKDADICAGLAQETDAQHSRRHPPHNLRTWASACARCAYQLWLRKGVRAPWLTWLQPKPPFMQGAWGLGCTFCAAGKHSQAVQQRRRIAMNCNKEKGVCKQAVTRAAKWSRYVVKCLLSPKQVTWNIEQHAGTDGHRLAMEVFHGAAFHLSHGTLVSKGDSGISFSQPAEEKAAMSAEKADMACPEPTPEKSSVVTGMPALDPFRGRVPQVKDWLDVWADSTSAVSFQGCSISGLRFMPPTMTVPQSPCFEPLSARIILPKVCVCAGELCV